MTETATKLERAIQHTRQNHEPEILARCLPASGKTAALQSVAQKLGCLLVNVNLELSKRLLELTRTQRSRQVERLLKEVIGPPCRRFEVERRFQGAIVMGFDAFAHVAWSGAPQKADPFPLARHFRVGPCVDGSGLARVFFTRAAVVGAAMCSAC
jgi:hypothetical protein